MILPKTREKTGSAAPANAQCNQPLFLRQLRFNFHVAGQILPAKLQLVLTQQLMQRLWHFTIWCHCLTMSHVMLHRATHRLQLLQ